MYKCKKGKDTNFCKNNLFVILFLEACGFETEDLEYTEHGLEHHHGALHTPAYEVQANVHNTETRTIN